MTPLTTTDNSSMGNDLQKQFIQLLFDGPPRQTQIGMMTADAEPLPKRETLHLNKQKSKLVIKEPT